MDSWKDAAQNVPASNKGGFMKFHDGQNKFRILSAPVQGWEYWTNDNKPIRSHEYPKVMQPDARKDAPKFFWAFVVWNMASKAVEILEITQRTIIEPIQELVMSEEWGNPTGYSLTVTRKGEGLNTEYSVVPSPAQVTPSDVLDAFKAKPIRLEALFDGSNPFEEKEMPTIEEEQVGDTVDDTNIPF